MTVSIKKFENSWLISAWKKLGDRISCHCFAMSKLGCIPTFSMGEFWILLKLSNDTMMTFTPGNHSSRFNVIVNWDRLQIGKRCLQQDQYGRNHRQWPPTFDFCSENDAKSTSRFNSLRGWELEVVLSQNSFADLVESTASSLLGSTNSYSRLILGGLPNWKWSSKTVYYMIFSLIALVRFLLSFGR